MDKFRYLQLKAERQALAEKPVGREVCLRCHRPHSICFCSTIQAFDPQIKFVILMHPMEARRERVGTGRLAHLCLDRSEIVVGLDFTDDHYVNQLIADPQYYPMVLYPGKTAHNISEKALDAEVVNDRTPLIFVIDGTWPCAKKMMKLSKNLHLIPRICFTPREPSRFEVKMQPHPMCLSTIESIHFFIGEWEKAVGHDGQNRRQILLDVFDKLVAFQKACALDPNLPSYRNNSYRAPSERRLSKKWEKYNLFFD